MTVFSTHGAESSNTMASPFDEAMGDDSSSTPAATDSAAPNGNPAQPLTPEQKERVRQMMLERLSATAAHFAHQQRDAPDLTQQEKFNIAAEILHRNPATFLARYSGIY